MDRLIERNARRQTALVIVGVMITSILLVASSILLSASSSRASTSNANASGQWRNLTNGNWVSSVAIDPMTGFIWSAGSGGAVRWDPTTGTYVKYTAVDGLAMNVVTAFAIAPDGTKWFGSEFGGVSRLAADGTWRVYGPEQWVGGTMVTDIAVDSNGNTWFLDFQGNVTQHSGDGSWRGIALGEGVDGVQVTFDLSNNVWFATGVGAVRLAQDGTITRFGKNDGLLDEDGYSIGVDPGGAIWVGTREGVSRRNQDGTWTPFALGRVRAMAFGPAGEKWFATDAGFAQLGDDGSFFYYSSLDVQDVVIDAAGAKWVAASDGLDRLTGQPRALNRRQFRTSDTIPRVDALSIEIDRQGNRWLGGYSNGIGRIGLDGSSESVLKVPGIDQVIRVQAIAEDVLGNMWFGTEKDGAIRRSSDGTWSTFGSSFGLSDNAIGEIAADPDGSVWFATDAGVMVRSASGNWRTYTLADGVFVDSVNTVAIDRFGTRWFGGYGGVSRLTSAGVWSTIRQPWAQLEQPFSINGITFDRNNNTWFVSKQASSDNTYAITRYSPDGTWWSFNIPVVSLERIDRGSTTAVASDSRGNIWMVTSAESIYERGVSRLDPSGQWTHFGAADGIGSTSVTDLAIDPITGDVWVALADYGVSVYSPQVATVFLPQLSTRMVGRP